MEQRAQMPSNTPVQELEDKVAKLQRAVYYLIWKRTGFGEQCVHCGHSYPGHAERCSFATLSSSSWTGVFEVIWARCSMVRESGEEDGMLTAGRIGTRAHTASSSRNHTAVRG